MCRILIALCSLCNRVGGGGCRDVGGGGGGGCRGGGGAECPIVKKKKEFVLCTKAKTYPYDRHFSSK